MGSMKISLYELLTEYTKDKLLIKYTKIIIPDIQRDYVMGSGGGKLTKLLKAMSESAIKNKDFNFSCIMGHVDKENNFFVYDGQQRLATLIYLSAYLFNKEENKKYMGLLVLVLHLGKY